jgi:hypothetical protein
LGEYVPNHSYQPIAVLRTTYERWKHIQARQLYTNSLQILWHIFLSFLQGDEVNHARGISFEEFMDWLEAGQPHEVMHAPLESLVQDTLEQLGLPRDWRQHHREYADRSKFEVDALTTFNKGRFTLRCAMDMLVDVFLRFYDEHLAEEPVWQELAAATQESHRLPLQVFFNSLQTHFDARSTFREVVRWLYQGYVLSQHEYMAIRKLRYNGYDTFKFHYVEGRFYPTKKPYEQPIRHPSLRLNNALTMLIDVGLVETDGAICTLSADGEAFLEQVEGLHGGH